MKNTGGFLQSRPGAIHSTFFSSMRSKLFRNKLMKLQLESPPVGLDSLRRRAGKLVGPNKFGSYARDQRIRMSQEGNWKTKRSVKTTGLTQPEPPRSGLV